MNLPRATLRWAVGLSSVLLIGACTVAGVFDPVLDGTVTAQVSTSPTPRLAAEVIAGNATMIYRVNVPTARELLYVEAEGSNLRVSLLSATGSTLGVSISPAYFASAVSGLDTLVNAGALESVVGPDAIDVAFVCAGPCVATRTAAQTYYLKVENRGASSQAFDVFAYTFDQNDTNEPNDAVATSTTVSGPGTAIGAIETLGDVDWFSYSGASVRELTFAEYDPPLGLILEIEGGPSLADGEADVVYPGDRFRVRSALSLAGPAGSSGYVVTVGAAVADTIDGTVSAEVTASPTPRLTSSVGASQTRTYRVNVPSPRDLFYGEVVGSDLRVTIKSLSGTTLAVSQDRRFFAASVASTVADAQPIAPSSISVQYACVGPCAAVAPTASSYLVEVRNLSGSTRTFDLYAYTFNETDENEANDSEALATVLNSSATDQGAVELLGDTDYFVYDATNAGDFFVVFDPFDLALGLQLEIVNCPTCVVLDGTSGRRVEGLVDGDVLRVTSATGRAGPSATSGYAIQVTASPPLSSVSTR